MIAEATKYEHAVILKHRELHPDSDVWHWSVVPEDLLYEANYIHSFNTQRLTRLMNKKEKVENENRVRDYGLDGLARTIEDGKPVYHGIQAKYYKSSSVTAKSIGTFGFVQMAMNKQNPLSRGYLYSPGKLQINLEEQFAVLKDIFCHVPFDWSGSEIVNPAPPTIAQDEGCESDLPLRDYQVEVLVELKDHRRSAINIPCRMGKTVIAGHFLCREKPAVLVVMAPLKISVDNLRTRLSSFLPEYSSILIDSDSQGTTDKRKLHDFMISAKSKSTPVVIYSTFRSAENILLTCDLFDDGMMALIDEAHHLLGSPQLRNWIRDLPRVTVMSATLPHELIEELDIQHISKVQFSKGLEGGYIVDYTMWLPALTIHENGTTSVEAKIPDELATYSNTMIVKVLYHATCMMRTGSRRTIVYLNSQDECTEYMSCFQKVIEDYHGIEDIWVGKITSIVDAQQRTLLLSQFQGGSKDSFRVLTSVRILDEAIDVPRCDSVFITSVGERSSDIRFFQRMQRSGTPDASNPNKRNNVFLWADGWEQCVTVFNSLRECDPVFHQKIRHTHVEYDFNGTRRQYVERDKTTNLKFLMWVNKIDCESVNDRMNQKARLLIKYVEKEKCVPSKSVEYKDTKIGQLWNKAKENGPNHNLYKSTLVSNRLLREDMERYLSDRETKRQSVIAIK